MRALVVAMLLAAAATAQADTIALVSSEPALRTALEDTFAPAGGKVLVVGDVKAPGIGELASSSRMLADRLGATVTVWLVAAGATSTLVTYDRAADRVIVRELPYALPLDANQASEVARIVRTMLGALRVNETEHATTAPSPQIETPPLEVAPREPELAVNIGGGVWVAAPAAVATPSAAITVAWRPHGLGVALTTVLAPRADLMKPSFSGEVRDTIVAAEVRNALVLQPRLFLVPAAGLGVHLLHIAGDTLDSRRYDPAFRVGLSALYALPRGFETGLSVSADCLLRRQLYQAGNADILAVPRVQIVTTLVFGIRL